MTPCHEHARRSPQPRRRHGAFTLVEVLLAVTLGSAVVSSVAVVTVQSMEVRKSATAEVQDRWGRVRAFDQFGVDLMHRITWLPESVRTLGWGGEADVLIEVLTLVDVPAADSAFRQRLPAWVTYRIQESGDAQVAKKLVREVRLLTNSNDSSYRQVLADGLSEASMNWHQGGGWIMRPARNDDSTKLPTAVRLTCTWRSDRSPQSRTVLLRDGTIEEQHGRSN